MTERVQFQVKEEGFLPKIDVDPTTVFERLALPGSRLFTGICSRVCSSSQPVTVLISMK